MARKYLDELFISQTSRCFIPSTDDNSTKDSLVEQYMEEREEIGFDSRETWQMHFTFACWLYEHLRAFQDFARDSGSLKYRKFNVPIVLELPDEGPLKNGGPYTKTVIETLSQEECIVVILSYLKDYIQKDHEDISGSWLRYDAIIHEKLQCAAKIWAIILPYMWW